MQIIVLHLYIDETIRLSLVKLRAQCRYGTYKTFRFVHELTVRLYPSFESAQ